MSGLLLDTNAFAMALTGDARLPEAARVRIETADRAALSVITFYEIGQKVRLGKWPAMAPHAPGLIDLAREDGFDLIPLTPAAALEASLMDWDHRDPFDRMIATVARHEGLPVVSSDAAFDALAVGRIWY
ncbi:type II toxin-antitoxin system VapC family toxin [Psychromarinibacter sp. C21-152]|uniref:Type II toxin-antitoxin system VapC family toxin n=1 Tax=Psychromarinibacter sediminicola TaxID=3033385 RepID=A0AAE3NMX0_9RHOB|nr:type II toxin-antitoxin system VapC family toxin [Psychromarinibacter sediminicola]MDF0600873.1 type II toxin-antitoxin system VapC family toxin [Psychromarinibacter sediminicola]